MNHFRARHPARATLALVVGALAMQACATKGYVRKQVAASQSTLQVEVATARDSAIRAADQNRMTADRELESRVYTHVDSQITAQITALRAELTSLRTEFNTRITVMEDSLKFGVPVVFNYDDASVREADKPVLDRFASIVKKYYPNARITIEGFADPKGSTSYNLALSKRRAESVQTVLVSNGVSATNLATVGYGETRLLTPRASKDEPGAEMNRRVVFVIETMGSPITAAALLYDK